MPFNNLGCVRILTTLQDLDHRVFYPLVPYVFLAGMRIRTLPGVSFQKCFAAIRTRFWSLRSAVDPALPDLKLARTLGAVSLDCR